MKINYLKILGAMAVMSLASCSTNEELNPNATEELAQQKLLTQNQINNIIKTSLAQKGDFFWKDTDALTIYSALTYSDYILTIGYGTSSADYARTNAKATQDIKENILSIIKTSESSTNSRNVNDLLIHDDATLNFIDVKVKDYATVKKLMSIKGIRYIEPSNYKFTEVNTNTAGSLEQVESSGSSSSGSGCGYDIATLNAAEYTVTTPNAKVPWNFSKHGITSAWANSTGRGVGIAIVDTGLSPEQSLLNADFNNGASTGRTLSKNGTFVNSDSSTDTVTDGVNDGCGHGTSMAAVAASPRNDRGLPVGVAYNSNLITYRATGDVVLDSYRDQRGVTNALKAIANRTDVKIVSMSIGHAFSVGSISDAIKTVYSKGKLIISAAGTSTSFTTWYGVIFPANMAEVVAATGITDASTYQACDVCHTGSEVDFTIIMQRSANKDITVPVLSYYNGQTDFVGGSSVATAMTSGIAALVWAKNPTWTRDQVLAKMKASSQFPTTRNSKFGHGILYANVAVQ